MKGSIHSEVEAQAERLGLPRDFYAALLKEDDWSFVIKLNALVEAACSDALAARFHAPELAPRFATLDLGHKKHGKVALLLASGALLKEQASVLQVLYELRNKLAHDISQVTFSFATYLSDADPKARATFLKHVGHGIKPEIMGTPRDDFVAHNPKAAMWATVSEVLACLHLEHDAAEARLGGLALQYVASLGSTQGGP